MQEPDSVELMERFRSGDRAALDALVDRHHASLIRYFHAQGRDRALAEDLAQEVWVRIVRHREKYQARARFQTYMFHIARNLWIDKYRSRKSAPGMISADLPVGGDGAGEGAPLGSLIPGKEPEPGETASVHEEADRVHRAVDRLPEHLRSVFELGEVQGLRYAEVSEILGIPVGTVKSRMHAAVKRLRAMLIPPKDDVTPSRERTNDKS
ncbi:MAG: RNA polymerase sigma factor [Planctomycetota bacterium]|jgi:RNA polymerase sigma-70 factor (ECF subfamily)